MHVFFYGSLMYDDVWDRLIPGNFRRKKAWISGYRRLAIKNEEYPGIVRGEGDIEGVIRFNLSSADIERLDHFETGCYQRISEFATVDQGKIVPVELYLIRKEFEHILEEREWDVTKFERSGMKRFIAEYPRFDL